MRGLGLVLLSLWFLCDFDSVKAPEVAESASPGAFQGWEDASIWGDGHQGVVYPYPVVPQDKEALIMVR